MSDDPYGAHERRLAMDAAKHAWADLEAADELDLPRAIGQMRLAMDRLVEASIAMRYAVFLRAAVGPREPSSSGDSQELRRFVQDQNHAPSLSTGTPEEGR